MEKTKKGGSILGGLIFILIGIALLGYNESRTVKTQSAINEALKVYIDVQSENVDPANEGKLIATKGKIDISNATELKDQTFNITALGVKLERLVEMYQWQEECTTDENNKEVCNYTKVWSEDINDSTMFENKEYVNPTSKKFETEEYFAQNVKLGAFDLSSRLIESLSYNEDLTYEFLSSQYKEEKEGFKLDGKYLINYDNTVEPKIGNLRISYKVAKDGSASILGVQKGNGFEAFTGKKGKSILTIRRGEYTGREILNQLTKENKIVKWLFRIVGTLLIIFGISSFFAPLQRLAGKVPILGSVVNTSTGLISLLLGFTISLLTIAIAWLKARPILALILIVIAIVLFIILKLNLGKSIKVSAANALKKEKNKIKDNIKS